MSRPWYRYTTVGHIWFANEIEFEQLIIQQREFLQQFFEKRDKRTIAGGIYGIYADTELIYIGKTRRDFKIRFSEHQQQIEHLKYDNGMILYKLLNTEEYKYKTITFKPLIELKNLKINQTFNITDKDLSLMELALITEHKPKGNLEGIILDYSFTKKDYEQRKGNR